MTPALDGPFVYVVSCQLDDRDVAREWLLWLRTEHVADVCARGALSADVVVYDGEPHHVDIMYRFRNREAFAEYERVHAPEMRALGLQRFPLALGLQYQRKTGVCVFSSP